VAVAGRRILAAGTDSEIQALAGADTRLIDLRGLPGATIIPGLIDAHVHFGWHCLALSQQRLDLDNVPTKAEAVARVAERARETGFDGSDVIKR